MTARGPRGPSARTSSGTGPTRAAAPAPLALVLPAHRRVDVAFRRVRAAHRPAAAARARDRPRTADSCPTGSSCASAERRARALGLSVETAPVQHLSGSDADAAGDLGRPRALVPHPPGQLARRPDADEHRRRTRRPRAHVAPVLASRRGGMRGRGWAGTARRKRVTAARSPSTARSRARPPCQSTRASVAGRCSIVASGAVGAAACERRAGRRRRGRGSGARRGAARSLRRSPSAADGSNSVFSASTNASTPELGVAGRERGTASPSGRARARPARARGPSRVSS